MSNFLYYSRIALSYGSVKSRYHMADIYFVFYDDALIYTNKKIIILEKEFLD